MIWPFFVIAMLVPTDAPSAQIVPSPEPTPLREIVHVKATVGVCRTLDTLVLPIAQIVGGNDKEFTALKKPLARFAGTEVVNSVFESMGSTAVRAPGEGLSGDNGDDPNIYTPERTMAASNIDRLVNVILHNLDSADRVMKQSWDARPKNSDPAIDALRQRVQNVIDLQRTLALRLDDSAGEYFSNSGVSGLMEKADRAAYTEDLGGDLGVGIATDATDPKELLLSSLPTGDVAAQKHGSAFAVARALRIQKLALSIESQRVSRACDAPTPGTSPSPVP
jgi:hypothetical protein